MSIILKKKKGLLTPKSILSNPSQVLGNLGLGSVIGTLSKKELMITEIIEEEIQRLIVEKMSFHSSRQLRGLEYFTSYHRVDGEKEIKNIYLKKRSWFNFICITREEMKTTGGCSKDFISFLKKKRCSSVKINREQFENKI